MRKLSAAAVADDTAPPPFVKTVATALDTLPAKAAEDAKKP
jgi:hypothetical protein